MKSIHEEWDDQDYLDFYDSIYGDLKPWESPSWDWYALAHNGEGEEGTIHTFRGPTPNGTCIGEGCYHKRPHYHR